MKTIRKTQRFFAIILCAAMLISLDGMSALAQGDISQSGEAKNQGPNDKESAGNAADSGSDSENKSKVDSDDSSGTTEKIPGVTSDEEETGDDSIKTQEPDTGKLNPGNSDVDTDDADTDDADSEEELTEEELEAIRKAKEEEGIMTLGDDPATGGDTTVIGDIKWVGDSVWKDDTRITKEAFEQNMDTATEEDRLLKLYKIEGGARVEVKGFDWEFAQSDSDDVYKYKITNLADGDYMVKFNAPANYSAKSGGEDLAGGEQVGFEGYIMDDIEATLKTKTFSVSNAYYGSGISAKYQVTVMKNTTESTSYKGEYKDSDTIKTIGGDSKATVESLASGTETTTTTVFTIPETYDAIITGAESSNAFIINDTTDDAVKYTFIKKMETSITKKWVDTRNDARPEINFDLKYTTASNSEGQTIQGDAPYAELGFEGKPVLARPTSDHTPEETYTYSDLPAYWKTEGGNWEKATYSMTEQDIEGYKSNTTNEGGKTVITNTKIKNVTATVEWKDDNDVLKKRPDTDKVTFVLHRYTTKDNDEIVSITPEIKDNGDGTWSLIYSEMPAYDSNSYPYTYYILENRPEVKYDDPRNICVYGEPKYGNQGEHSQITDRCFVGGTITNIKEDTTKFSVNYVWKGTGGDRPETAQIFLWRYIKDADPSTAAIVKEAISGVYTIKEAPIDTGKPANAQEEITITDIPKYDENGQEYIYIAKVSLSESTAAKPHDFIYVYEDDKIYADENETIVLMPQKTIEHQFTMKWNTAAYPDIPGGWTAKVHYEKKTNIPGDDTWRSAKNIPDEKLEYGDFSSNVSSQDRMVELPKFETDSNDYQAGELQYRMVIDGLVSKADGSIVTPEETEGVTTFIIDGRQYKTEIIGGNVYNSLYELATYNVHKVWNPALSDVQKAAGNAVCKVELHDGENNVVRELTLDESNNWKGQFAPQNRFDENGYEEDFKVIETFFFPINIDDPTGGSYSKMVTYTVTDAGNKQTVEAKATNYRPDGGRYISVCKNWVDGGDVSARRNIVTKITTDNHDDVDDGGYYKYENIDNVLVNQDNGWSKSVKIASEKDNTSNFIVVEKGVTAKNSEATDTELAYRVGRDTVNNRDILITDDHRYEVTVSGSIITNKVVGKIKPAISIEWQDGGSDAAKAARGSVKATLHKSVRGGPVESVAGAVIQLTQDVNATGDGNTWFAEFGTQEKYDDEGYLITYRILLDFDEDKYRNTTVSETYVANETKNTYVEADYTDEMTRKFTLTRTGKKDVKFYKRWLDDGTAKQPDINLTIYQQKVGDGAAKLYDKTKNQYGFIERVWEKKENGLYECTIRNLEANDADGVPFQYFVTEEMHTPGEYVGHYFVSQEAFNDWDGKEESESTFKYIDSEGNVKETRGCPENLGGADFGYIVNRQEGTIDVEGRKVWNNLEEGMTGDDLPDISVYIERKKEGEADLDDEFNQKPTGQPGENLPRKYEQKLDKDNRTKYSFKGLPKYDENGKKYVYSVKEDFSTLENNPYDSYVTTANDFLLVNNYMTGDANSRIIKVTKNWDTEHIVNNATYPDITFELWRFETEAEAAATVTYDAKNSAKYKVDSKRANNDSYTLNSKGEQSLMVEFDKQRMISPKGKMYTYKVVELVKNGYVESVGGDIVADKSIALTNAYLVTISNDEVKFERPTGSEPAGYYTTKLANESKTAKFTNKYVGSENAAANPAVEITGNKKWSEGTGETNLRPDITQGISIKVYRSSKDPDGVKSHDTASEEITDKCNVDWRITDANTWSYTITPKAGDTKSLVTYAPNGGKYQYVVEENPIPEQYAVPKDSKGKPITSVTEKSKVTDTATNKTTVKMNDLTNILTGNLKVTKTWKDNGNKYGLRPKKLTLKIQRTPVAAAPEDESWQDVKKPDNNFLTMDLTGNSETWTGELNGLPPVDSTNTPYKYRAIEWKMDDIKIPAGGGAYAPEYTHKTVNENNTTTIINTIQSVQLKVVKSWVGDSDNAYGSRPGTGGNWSINADLQFHVKGGTSDWKTFASRTLTGTENTAEVTFEDLPKYDFAGQEYEYRAVEKNPPKNYVPSSESETASGIYTVNLKNTLKLDSSVKTSVKVKKVWHTDDGIDTKVVEVELLQSVDGGDFKVCTPAQKVELKKSNGWAHVWDNVPAYDTKGFKISYKVRENSIKDGGANLTKKFSNSVTDVTTAEEQKQGQKNYKITNTELVNYKLETAWVNNKYGHTEKATYVLYRKVKDAAGASVNAQSDRTGWTPMADKKYTKELTGDKTHLDWKALPKYNENGNEYVYQAVETKIGDNTLPLTNPSDDYKTYEITNAATSTSPDTADAGREVQSHKITNTLVLTDKSGAKKWDFSGLNENLKDATNAKAYMQSLIPASIQLTLQYRAGSTGSYANVQTLANPKTAPAASIVVPSDKTQNWSYKFSGVPKYALDGTTEISYIAVETLPANSSFTKEENNGTNAGDIITTITNKITATSGTSTISGKKTWVDFGNKYSLRPAADGFKLNVYENGNLMTVQPKITWVNSSSTGTEWTYKIEGLPKYVLDSGKYRAAVYTIDEVVPLRYFKLSKNTNGTELSNQLSVIEVLNTSKEVDSKYDVLKGAKFTLKGVFQNADKTETSATTTVGLELTDGRLILTPEKLGSNLGLLPDKTYTLTQTKVADGYQKIDTDVKFKIDSKMGKLVIETNAKMHDNKDSTKWTDSGKVMAASGTTPAILQIQNCRTSAEVKLIKHDSADESKKLENVKFKLYRMKGTEAAPATDDVMNADGSNDGTRKAVLATDSKGEILVTGLPEGKYYFIETDTRDDYEVDNTAQDFEITAALHNTVKEIKVSNTKLDSSLQIKKLDGETGDPISGVEFKIEYKPASITEPDETITAVTGTNGVAVNKVTNKIVELKKGEYTITETKAHSGYYINNASGNPFKCSFNITSGQDIKFVQINEKWLNSPHKSGVTNKEAITFKCESDVYAAFLHREDDQGTGIYNSRIYGGVSLTKEDGTDSTKLNGAVFDLKKKNAQGDFDTIGSFTTGEKYDAADSYALKTGEGTQGVVNIVNMTWGTYQLVEKTAPKGYFMGGTAPSWEFVVGADSLNPTKTVTNSKTGIKLAAQEDYDSKTPIGDVSIKLTGTFAGETTETSDVWNTTDTPKKTFEGSLIAGNKYSITQDSVRDGYEVWDAPVEFHIDNDGNVVFDRNDNLSDGKPAAQFDNTDGTIFVRNVRKHGLLRIEKLGIRSKPLKDITFDLYDAGGTKIKEHLTTDENGIWKNNETDVYLTEGSYYIKENMRPEGYRDQRDDEYRFEINADNLYNAVDKRYVVINVQNLAILDLVDNNQQGEVLGAYRFAIKGKFKDPDTGNLGVEGQIYYIVEEPDPAKPEEITLEEVNKRLLPNENYVITQTEINSGYKLVEGEITLHVDEDGIIQVVGDSPDGYQLSDDGTKLIVVNSRKRGGYNSVPEGGTSDEPEKASEPKPGPGEDIQKPDTTGKDPDKPSKPERPSTYVVEVIGWFYPPEGGAPQYTTVVVSSDNPNALNGRLVPGQSYRVKIINAPDGYEGPLTDTLYVDADGNIHCGDMGRFLLNGRPYIRTTRPVAARTGDGSLAVWWTIIFLLSMFMVLLLGRKKIFVEKS